ncbi:MAG: hypothetical protein WHS65_04690 [Melioribacteraceae bacterium]
MKYVPAKYCICIFLMTTLFTTSSSFEDNDIDKLSNQNGTKGNQFLVAGEDLTYEVSWWFIKIGTIRTIVTEIKKQNDDYLIKASVFIDSYSGLPFVNLHSIFETEMDNNCF